ncbi:MAG: hypothetical protein KHX56_11570, partial [Clostridiales bacterium]|nr:hypothetical protein [Clostridiales bacterium]
MYIIIGMNNWFSLDLFSEADEKGSFLVACLAGAYSMGTSLAFAVSRRNVRIFLFLASYNIIMIERNTVIISRPFVERRRWLWAAWIGEWMEQACLHLRRGEA